MITLIPVGGLANRLRTICSGIELARKHNYRIKIVWFKDKGLNSSFRGLFEPINLPDIFLKEGTLVDKLFIDRPRQKNFYIPGIYQTVAFQKRFYPKEMQELTDRGYDFNRLCAGGSLYIASYTAFYPFSSATLLKMFRPIESIRKRIDSFTANFQQHETIGIHIRRTDHIISIQESPTELFFERIDKRLRISPNTCFYLATDSEEEKVTFMERYGNKIYTLEEKADRTNYSGMQHAVTEFFLLSRTKEI
ncbi:MAG: glycosyl transferase [Bacteroides sp.]|nr:glycosyl transferase [Bacteroides sp.]